MLGSERGAVTVAGVPLWSDIHFPERGMFNVSPEVLLPTQTSCRVEVEVLGGWEDLGGTKGKLYSNDRDAFFRILQVSRLPIPAISQDLTLYVSEVQRLPFSAELRGHGKLPPLLD